MRCKHIMLGATMFAAAAFAAPAFAQTGSQTNPASTPSTDQAQPADQMQPSDTGTSNYGAGTSGMQNSTYNNQASGQSVPLTSVSDSKTKIMSAPVQDAAGNTIGTVQQVNTSSSGKAQTVDVTLTTPSGKSKTVKIKASKLKYDSGSNLLKANLTKSEIEKLPTATTTTNP